MAHCIKHICQVNESHACALPESLGLSPDELMTVEMSRRTFELRPAKTDRSLFGYFLALDHFVVTFDC